MLIHAAELRARELGIAEVIAIVDDGGNFVASHRMDHAWLASVDIAHNKAWTAVALKVPTASLAPLAVPSGELYGINTTNHGRVVVFGGGFRCRSKGESSGRSAQAAVRSQTTLRLRKRRCELSKPIRRRGSGLPGDCCKPGGFSPITKLGPANIGEKSANT
ncbi:GlcG/HbpS family heme-binding protein [Paenibacillus sp. FJAT-27812]|uniref:GlcG/HbpS family heme-binding protein n=1 Tax=Paenibacillus sp. FJAT-27812 TaxID=1684143 RepID=UPI002F42212C